MAPISLIVKELSFSFGGKHLLKMNSHKSYWPG